MNAPVKGSVERSTGPLSALLLRLLRLLRGEVASHLDVLECSAPSAPRHCEGDVGGESGVVRVVSC
jgi:hypothetical protein